MSPQEVLVNATSELGQNYCLPPAKKLLRHAGGIRGLGPRRRHIVKDRGCLGHSVRVYKAIITLLDIGMNLVTWNQQEGVAAAVQALPTPGTLRHAAGRNANTNN